MLAGCTAVVLAGGDGSRLRPLCGDACPKPLLKVANRPMIYYPLRWLHDNGFKEDIIVVTTAAMKEALQAWLQEAHKDFGFRTKLRATKEDTDSADALRAVADDIRRDALVVSCDSICDVPLADVLLRHRRTDAAATLVLRHAEQDDAARKQRAKERQHTEYVGLDTAEEDRVVFFASSGDFEDPLVLKKTFLLRRPNMSLTTALVDTHIHVYSKWALQALRELDMRSLKHEFLPVLVTQQWRRHAPGASAHGMGFFRQPPPSADLVESSEDGAFPAIHNASDLGARRPGRAGPDPTSVRAHIVGAPRLEIDPVALKAAVEPRAGCFASRISYQSQLVAVTKHIAKGAAAAAAGTDLSGIIATELAPTTTLPPALAAKVTVSPPSLFAEGLQVATEEGQKVVVKGSVLGKDVRVGGGTRVMQSIIMDGAEVGAGCKLQNCVVAERAVIKPGAQLTDCMIGFETEVAPGEYKGEVIGGTFGLR